MYVIIAVCMLLLLVYGVKGVAVAGYAVAVLHCSPSWKIYQKNISKNIIFYIEIWLKNNKIAFFKAIIQNINENWEFFFIFLKK